MSTHTKPREGESSEYPFDTWNVIGFEDFGAIEVLDSGPENSGHGELDKTLLVLPSLLFPGAPPKAFLQVMNAAGFRVIYVRRRGFGLTSIGNDWAYEVELIRRLIDHLKFKIARCLALGSAAPLGLQLYEQFEEVRCVDFVNIASSAVPDNAIQNRYLKKMVAQSIVGRAGAHMVAAAIKWQIRRNGPLAFAKTLYSPSVDDITFLKANENLMWDAVASLSAVSPICLRDEIVAAFVRDHEPIDIPEKQGFAVLTGPDVPGVFKQNALEFSQKCGAENVEFSKGGVMSVFLCADEYVEFIQTQFADV